MKTILTTILLAITALGLSTGCNPQKKLSRAKEMVLLDPQARHEVFLKELQFFPCANDSSSVLLPGAIDSATLSAYYDWINGKTISSDSTTVTDLVYRPNGPNDIKTTTLPYVTYLQDSGGVKFVNGSDYIMRISKDDKGRDVITFGNKTIQDVFDYAYKKGVKDYIKKHPPRFPDTLKTSIKDKQYIKLLEDALAKERQEKAQLQGTVDAQAKDIDKKDKKITGWIWWFIAAVVLFIVTLILGLIGKIKRVFP